MELHIVARGKIGRSPEAELVQRYLRRITWPTRITELPDRGGKEPESGAACKRILLDEKGKNLSSLELAQTLETWRDTGIRECQVWIGAADGFDNQYRDSADLLIAFGKMTWPHLLVRALVAEQLYRATTIIANHPYHREG